MKPALFPQANKELLPPKGLENCTSLHVYCDNTHCISKWKPSIKDRFRVFFGGNIWLWVHSGGTQPPVAVDTENPWKPKK